jgi:hypothetical protein
MNKRSGRRHPIRWLHKYWTGRFLFEFLVVVAGVLVAWPSMPGSRTDRTPRVRLLALLSRDLERTITDLEEFVAFEKRQLDDGVVIRPH